MTATDTDPRLDQLRQQVAQANERIRDLAGERDQMAINMRQALQDERNIQQCFLRAEEAENSRLAEELRAAHAESDHLAELLADATAECDQTRRERDQRRRSASAAWERAHELRAALTAECESHQATMDEAAGQVAALTSDLEQKATALRIYIDDRHEMQAQVAALTSQCERLEAVLLEYIDFQARDGAQIVRLEMERDMLLRRLETVRVTCDC